MALISVVIRRFCPARVRSPQLKLSFIILKEQKMSEERRIRRRREGGENLHDFLFWEKQNLSAPVFISIFYY